MIITENMPGANPDLFAAITVFAGVPFGRFAGLTLGTRITREA